MHMNIHDYAEKEKISTRGVLDFTLLTNPIGPSNGAKNAMRAALKTINRFPDPSTRYLRRHIARTEHIDPENILFGHGSTHLLELILTRFRPGKVLVPAPLPTHHASMLQGLGIDFIPFPLDGRHAYSLDAGRLMASIDGVDMLLVSNPHGVTGTVIPLSALLAVADRIEGSDSMLVIDEALIEFTQAGSPVERAIQSRNILILRSFSLYHALAGLRLGYAVGNTSLLNFLAGPAGCGLVNTVAAAGAITSLRDKGFRMRTAEFLKAEKAYLVERLGRVDKAEVIDTPCGFVLVRLQKTGEDVRRGLEARHMLVETFEDESGLTLLRVPVRRHRENARFAKTLLRIARPSDA
jgi:threonine-phosphate decarboxylase